MMKRMLGVAAVAAAVMAAPAGASAQVTVDVESGERVEQARVLSEQGWMLANQDGNFGQAAVYLRHAAWLRGDDAESVHDLLNAGRFHYYAHRPMQAVSALREAGETALRSGDGDTAERAFLDAAWVAAKEGDLVTARNLLSRTDPMRWRTVAAQGVAALR